MVKQPRLKTTNSLALGHSQSVISVFGQSLGHIPSSQSGQTFGFPRLAYLEAPSTNTECWVASSEGSVFSSPFCR